MSTSVPGGSLHSGYRGRPHEGRSQEAQRNTIVHPHGGVLVSGMQAPMAWANLKNTRLSERSQTLKTTFI